MRVGATPMTVLAIPLAVLAAAMAVIATDAGDLPDRVRAVTFDAYQRIDPRPYQDPLLKSGLTVRTLQPDAASMAKFGPWPWPPETLAKLTLELKAAGAAMVVYDFPLDHGDPISAVRIASNLPPGPKNDAAREALAALPEPDDEFARALASVRTVTGFTLDPVVAGHAPELKSAVEGSPGTDEVPYFGDAAGALPAFEKASAGVGAFALTADADGKLRRVPLIVQLNDKLVPTIDGEAVRLAASKPALDAVSRESDLPLVESGSHLAAVRAGQLEAPVDRSGAVIVHFSGADPARTLSPAALDAGSLKKDQLKDAVVYFGAPGRKLETPLGPRTRAGIRAEAMENVLLGEALRPADSMPAAIAVIVIVGLGMIFLFARLNALWAGLFAGAAVLAVQAFAWNMFARNDLLFDATNPSLALGLAYFAALGARGVEVVNRRGRLRNAFAEALPARALDKIARNPQMLKLDGEMRTVTCLSCGVRGYAKLAEGFRDDPAGFTALMRSVLMPLANCVFQQGGTVDRYGGEGFTAFWNAPLDDAEHAIHACEAANRMTVALAEVNERLSRERRVDGTAYDPVEIGIALATGPAIAGAFGSGSRLAYSVTGDCTVLVERIRTLSPHYGPAVVVSDDTRKAAERGFAFLEVDFIAPGPRDDAVRLYAMLGNPLVRASPKFRAMATFHDHIFQAIRAQQWSKARELIEQCRKLSGASQKMYDLHLKRIDWYESNPPGADWDGAFRSVLD